MEFTYRYYVTAVATLPPSGTTESQPTPEDHGWLNYCAQVYTDSDGTHIHRCVADTTCALRRDPDGHGDGLVCGNENALLEMPGNNDDTIEDQSLQKSGGQPSDPESQAEYRIIGLPPTQGGDGGGNGGGSPPSNPYTPPARFVFYHLDHLGSPRVLLDASGARVSVHHYLPFGEERPFQSDPTLGTKAFTGHERDSETGLDYMGARYYSSSIGRFISVDPEAGSIAVSDPQSWNRYGYVRNRPVNSVDPNGAVPVPVGRIEPYPVRAKSAFGAWSIANQHFKTSDGNFPGATSTVLRVSYNYLTVPGSDAFPAVAMATNVVVSLNWNTGLPQWVNASASSPEQQASWNSDVADVASHEECHVQIGMQEGESLESTVTFLVGTGSNEAVASADLDIQVFDATVNANNEMDRRQREFDTKTNHRGTQLEQREWHGGAGLVHWQSEGTGIGI